MSQAKTTVAQELRVDPKWAKMDPTWLIEYLREETRFDANHVEQMLLFAIEQSKTATAGLDTQRPVAEQRDALYLALKHLVAATTPDASGSLGTHDEQAAALHDARAALALMK